jgi:hypothetical protein
VLLVLDDVTDPEQLELLLPGTPSCAVITTSRRILATLPGARHLRLGPLDDSEATVLLKAIIGGRRFDEQPHAARKLAQLCNGNPMVIRDVSACLLTHQKLPLQWLADAMTSRHQNMAELVGTETQFHRTMRHSHDALSPRTRAVLRKIASMSHTQITLKTLAKLTEGNNDLVIPDLLAAGFAYPASTSSNEPSYQLNEWLLTYVKQLQP